MADLLRTLKLKKQRVLTNFKHPERIDTSPLYKTVIELLVHEANVYSLLEEVIELHDQMVERITENKR
jgi:hypothetical protein